MRRDTHAYSFLARDANAILARLATVNADTDAVRGAMPERGKLLGRYEARTTSDGVIRFTPIPAAPVSALSLSLAWPCDHRPAQISHPYGEERKDFTHEGVDIVALMGSVIRSPVLGEVFQAGEWGFYGKRVAVRWLVNDKQYEVYLAHLSRIDVKVGQLVAASEQVGLSGNSGNSTKPHLHLTLRDPSNPLVLRGIKASFNGCIDPAPYLVMP